MSEQVWSAVLAAIPDVDTWNRNLPELKRLAEEYGPDCKAFIHAEVERRGYLWSSVSKCYIHPWIMHACQGKNLIGVGYKGGQLAVIFASKEGPKRYESVSHEVPEEVAAKLARSPFPDKLYAQIVKGRFEMQKVGN